MFKSYHINQQTLHGILYMVASMACFSSMNIIIRHVSLDLHTTQIVLIRNVFSALIFTPWIIKHGMRVLHTARIKDHFWRAAIGIIGMQGWFFAIASMPLTEATAISFTAPIFTAIFAICFLGEKAGWHRWAAIVAGFIGTMIILRPSGENFNLMSLVVMFATSQWAIASMLVKSLTRTEPPERIVFYMSVFMALLALPVAIPFWQTPSALDLLACFGIAIASTGAHVFLVRAYARADIVVLMPFDFTRLIFTAILAYIFYHEVSDEFVWLGAAVVIASAAYIAHRETLHRKKPPPEVIDA